MKESQALRRLLTDVRKVASHLWAKGWAEKNAGNLSVRVTDLFPGKAPARGGRFLPRPVAQRELAGECFLVTGTGARFRDVAEDPKGWAAVVRVAPDLSGFRLLWGGKAAGWAPTSELPSHLKIHALLKRSGGAERAVLHTHPTELVALTHLPDCPTGGAFTDLLWGMIPEVKMYTPGGAALAPYWKPGTEGLADRTLAALEGGAECVVWEMHGTLSVGAGPQEAFDVVDVLDKAAKVALLVRATGASPKGLSAAQLAEIEEDFPRPGPRRGPR
jgi:rhamnulose-1-phosphate aldolase